jgi:hypothetical protein
VVHALDDDQNLDVVDEGGPGTLLVQITMLDIDSNIPPEAPDPGKKVRPVTAQGVVVFDLIDAETGVLQARVGERRRSRRAKGVEVPEGVGERWVQVFELAESAAIDLRTELDRLRDGA